MQPLKRNSEDREPLQWLHVSSSSRDCRWRRRKTRQKQYWSRRRFSHTLAFPCAGRTAGLAGHDTYTVSIPVSCQGRWWKRATDQECATRICPPTSLEFFDTGVFYLGLDTERRPGHGGITV